MVNFTSEIMHVLLSSSEYYVPLKTVAEFIIGERLIHGHCSLTIVFIIKIFFNQIIGRTHN